MRYDKLRKNDEVLIQRHVNCQEYSGLQCKEYEQKGHLQLAKTWNMSVIFITQKRFQCAVPGEVIL